jgi:hypothetical protein
MLLARLGGVLLIGQLLIMSGVTSASGDERPPVPAAGSAGGFIYAYGEDQDLEDIRTPLQFNTTGALEGWKLDIGQTNTVFTAPADGVYSVDFSVVFSALPNSVPATVQVCLGINDELPSAPCIGVTVAPAAATLPSPSLVPASREVFVNLLAQDRVRVVVANAAPPTRTESQTITIQRVAP